MSKNARDEKNMIALIFRFLNSIIEIAHVRCIACVIIIIIVVKLLSMAIKSQV